MSEDWYVVPVHFALKLGHEPRSAANDEPLLLLHPKSKDNMPAPPTKGPSARRSGRKNK